MSENKYLEELFTFEEPEKKESAGESYEPGLAAIEKLLENIREKNPMVIDFHEKWWKKVSGDFSREIILPENRETKPERRLIPFSDDALGYMIISDLELALENSSYIYGQKMLEIFDPDSWLQMIGFWEEDEALEVHEKRFTDNIKTDFVNFFKDAKLREAFDEDMRGLYEKCRKELERKDA